MTSKIKIGVIGAGAIAQRAHIPGLSPERSRYASMAAGPYQYGGCSDSQVIAVSDIDKLKADNVATKFGIPNVYYDWRDLIANKDIQAVTIALPNYLHAEVAIAATNAGKHVLVEKPMATSLDEADRMIASAEEAGVVLMVEQTERFIPTHEVAKEIITTGQIGKIGFVRTRSSHQGPEVWSPGSGWFFKKDEASYGTMFDLGIHKLDLVRWLIDDEIEEVCAFSTTLFKQQCEVEDQAAAILRFSKGALCVLETAWTTNPPENATYIYGSEGNLKFGGRMPLTIEFPTRNPLNFNFTLPKGSISNATLKPLIPNESKVGGPFRNFIKSIKTGSKPLVDGHEGRASLAVILAALKSADLHQFVKLNNKEDKKNDKEA